MDLPLPILDRNSFGSNGNSGFPAISATLNLGCQRSAGSSLARDYNPKTGKTMHGHCGGFGGPYDFFANLCNWMLPCERGSGRAELLSPQKELRLAPPAVDVHPPGIGCER